METLPRPTEPGADPANGEQKAAAPSPSAAERLSAELEASLQRERATRANGTPAVELAAMPEDVSTTPVDPKAMRQGESQLDYIRRMKALERGDSGAPVAPSQPPVERTALQANETPLDVYRRENRTVREQRGDVPQEAPVSASSADESRMRPDENPLAFYRRINQAEQARRAAQSERPADLPANESPVPSSDVKPFVFPAEEQDSGMQSTELPQSREQPAQDNDRDASIRETMRSPWFDGEQPTEAQRPAQADRVENAEAGELDAIDRAADKLEAELQGLGGIRWEVEAGTTPTGYGIRITEPGTDQVLELAALLKDPAATAAYKELLGALEFAAMERQQLKPGEFRRAVEVVDSEMYVRDELPAETSFLDRLWSKAAEKQEQKPVTEQKESKLKGLFARGRAALGGLRERAKGWFARERASVTVSEAVPATPSVVEELPQGDRSPETAPQPRVSERPLVAPEVVAVTAEVLDEGELQLEAVLENPARATEAVRELTAKSRDLQEQADRLNRRLEMKGLPGNERKKAEKLLQSTMNRLRAEIDGKVA
ncbi:MAG: hypothetical protein ACOYBJ_01690 [Patescibacteria group bacterium]